MITWRTTAVALAAATVLLTSACGSGGDSAESKPSPTATAEQSAAPESGQMSGQLRVAVNPELGPLVTDDKGFTLYRFTKDSRQPSKSACEDACAKTWPPVPAEGVTLPAGVPVSLLGSVKRPDGIEQLTLGGIPAYRYSKDVRPGDVKGEGVGGTWFASLPKEGIPGLEDALARYQENAGATAGTTAPTQ
jgi:predicted lipoprotein with Yx(FWY)xxD motif